MTLPRILLALPLIAGALLAQEPVFFLMARQLGHEPKTQHDDRATEGEQSDLKPAGLPKKHLDGLRHGHHVDILRFCPPGAATQRSHDGRCRPSNP